MAVANPPAATKAEVNPGKSGGGFGWAAAFFMAPAALLLIVFLVFPTLYTVALSFNRGRTGQFTEWVGLDNYIRLFTQDPNFLNLGFPPSGALWNNVLWLIFYTSACIFFGLIIAVMATRVRYEAVIKGIVFLPMAIAAASVGIIWSFVYSPNPNQGLMNALLGTVGAGPLAVLGNPDTVNWRSSSSACGAR